MRTLALIVAAGSGLRVGGERPKQYQLLNGRPVLCRTVEAFLHHPKVDEVRVVIAKDHGERYAQALAEYPLPPPIFGGKTRQQSVLLGLEALEKEGVLGSETMVLIHDGARPFVSSGLVTRLLEALCSHTVVIPALPVVETVVLAEGQGVASLLERERVKRLQTPQGFLGSDLLRAHRRAREEGVSFSDDGSLAHWFGLSVHLCPGEESNVKLTTPHDFQAHDPAPPRFPVVGQGFDVHAFTEGDHVTICGVRIPHTKALLGHSDADVALHALTDAILGTLGEGDIGVHFPPTDPQWKGAPSDIFLRHALSLLQGRGGVLAHADITLVAEGPKFSPHLEAMKARLSDLLSLEKHHIAIKATTSEGLGFVGRGEGIVAFATATCYL